MMFINQLQSGADYDSNLWIAWMLYIDSTTNFMTLCSVKLANWLEYLIAP